MITKNLDSIYSVLDKHILLVESYTEIPNLSLVIKACRLKPYRYFFKRRINDLILYKWWFDEFNNSLKLNGKKIQIIYGDLSLDKKSTFCTDLYNGLTIDKVAKFSKRIFVKYGKDEDLNKNCALLSMLGIDNYLRSYIYLYDYWQKVPSLYLGLNTLCSMFDNLNINYCKELKNTKDTELPVVDSKSWISDIPMDKELSLILKKECKFVYEIF